MKKQKLKALFYPDVPFESLYIPYIYKEIYFDGVYQDIFDGSKDPVYQRRDLVVVDVGANIGVVTQHMRDFAKKVYSIEPSPEHFAALKQNKEFNDWDNVEVFNYAIADKDGEMSFSINEGNRTMNSLVIGKDVGDGYRQMGKDFKVKPRVPYKEGLTVPTKSMDSFFEENKIEHVDFMKFDVEGAEDLILRSEGFQKVANKIKAIEVEFHYPNWRELVNYMIELGYEARQYQSNAIIVLFTR